MVAGKKKASINKAKRVTARSKNRIDLEERLTKVESWLAAGLRYSEVVKAAMATTKNGGWMVSRPTAEDYIKKVYARWAEKSAASRPEVSQKVRECALEVYKRALNGKDYRGAIIALELYAKTEGIVFPSKVEVDVPKPVQVEVSGSVIVTALMSDPETSDAAMKVIRKLRGAKKTPGDNG